MGHERLDCLGRVETIPPDLVAKYLAAFSTLRLMAPLDSWA